MAEWARAWADGPDILVLKRAHPEAELIDAVTARFREIIEQERRDRIGGGDHFAKAGANDRVWNALEKLCLADPALFARYYANDMIALASEAWLGPGYQITSQINNVRPGGVAQTPHRDYHLGFCSAAQAERYPSHVHRLSPALTLQGAIAHVEMPLESGPTLYLPHSQKYAHGYLLADRTDFREYFEKHHVQLPLSKGDAVFFNPALDRVLAASAEGYAFPTNLDRDPPLGGLAPESVQTVVRRALMEDWEPKRLNDLLDKLAAKRLS